MSELNSRRKNILAAAVRVAEVVGYSCVTRAKVAREAGCSESLVQFHFNTMSGLKEAVVEAGVEFENLKVIGQGLALGHVAARRAPRALRLLATHALQGAE